MDAGAKIDMKYFLALELLLRVNKKSDMSVKGDLTRYTKDTPNLRRNTLIIIHRAEGICKHENIKKFNGRNTLTLSSSPVFVFRNERGSVFPR